MQPFSLLLLAVLHRTVEALVSQAGEFQPLPGCSYNVSSSMSNFQPEKFVGAWYVDSILSLLAKKPEGHNCYHFNITHRDKTLTIAHLAFRKDAENPFKAAMMDCVVSSSNDDHSSDYIGRCTMRVGPPLGTGVQQRFIETDYSDYALLYMCPGPADENITGIGYLESAHFLSRSHQGLSSTTRQRLKRRLEDAGWYTKRTVHLLDDPAECRHVTTPVASADARISPTFLLTAILLVISLLL